MLAPVLHMALWRVARAPHVVPAPPPSQPVPKLEVIKKALARAERLVPRKPKPKMGKLLVLRPPPPPEPEAASAWDPEEGVSGEIELELNPLDDDELMLQTINGCKTLMLEIIRRAAYDYTLYKSSRRMVQRVLADQAYRWIFMEKPGTVDWQHRQNEGKFVTSFESICESLDLDPDNVRSHIKRLTPKNVMSVGRPAEYRRRDVFSANAGDDVYATPGVLVEFDDGAGDEPSY